MNKLIKRPISSIQLLIFVVLFTSLFNNFSFFRHAGEVYHSSFKDYLFLISLFAVLSLIHFLILNFLSLGGFLRWVLVIVLFFAASASYFVDSYGIIVDESMISNIFNTDPAEATGLLSVKLMFYFLGLFILPSYIIFKFKLKPQSFREGLVQQAIAIPAALLLLLVNLLVFGDSYASYFREHKALRSYANPASYIYAVTKYLNSRWSSSSEEFVDIGEDANISEEDLDRELIIFVLGETARADHFSLNGYQKKTNPILEKEDVVSFKHMQSCGTSTAQSVPCMFSNLGRSGFSEGRAGNTGNVLDVMLESKKINILWRDNNSDSKGVAKRIEYEDFKTGKTNKVCDSECRDVGMLGGLQDYINSQKSGDILIVLHQMGNHGPSYYKRYPPEFKKFTPVCETNELSNCTRDEIINAYDNAILYTDYFLGEIIQLLKKNSHEFETGMVYVSDHGESLGESGIYLHGLPYLIAPESQKHVASIMWFGGHLRGEIDMDKLKKAAETEYSHDNVFHTLLGLMEIQSSVYDKSKDILSGIKIEENEH
jgi:lipid A ethanolaminephosphotransferase